jgi:hypothetical protein
MLNTGNLTEARLKAGITRRTGTKVKEITAARDPAVKSLNKAPRLKVYKGTKKFLGSFRQGGHVQRTGLYLCHKGEFVVPTNTLRRP